MFELNNSEYNRIVPLLTGVQQKVLPYAICQGINPGRVLVDRREDARLALLWSRVGYYILAGDPYPEALPTLCHVLTDLFIPDSQTLGETGFILMTSTPAWKAYLPDLLPKREISEIFRRPFLFNHQKFIHRGEWRKDLPPGFKLEFVDGALADRLGILGSWGSADAYARHGFGYALFDGNELASKCTSVLSSQTHVEIDVDTNEKYRRRGLAILTASAFIEECLLRGKQPHWECFWDNSASTALAIKLGFEPLLDYPVYYWEEITK